MPGCLFAVGGAGFGLNWMLLRKVELVTPTILLADDDPSLAMLLERAFKKASLPHSIQVITDGDAAVAYLSHEGKYADKTMYPAPALLILDLGLPRRSGFEVLDWLRSQECLRRLPVIVLTSSQEASDVNRAYEHGANSYLLKPIGADGLMDLVQNVNHYWLELNQRPTLDEF
jgi:CheY-like chemotaxis protein